MTATSIDDARARAARLLESLEKCISSRAGAEAAQNFQKVGTFNACIHFKPRVLGVQGMNFLPTIRGRKA